MLWRPWLGRAFLVVTGCLLQYSTVFYMPTQIDLSIYLRCQVLSVRCFDLRSNTSRSLRTTQTTSHGAAVPVAGCMHARSARALAHTLRAHAPARPPRDGLSPAPPPVLPLPPIITPWPTVSTHRLPCVFRCFGKRMAKQALGYVHTWVGAASASTGLPLPVSATGSGRVLPRLWPGCWGAGPTSRYSR